MKCPPVTLILPSTAFNHGAIPMPFSATVFNVLIASPSDVPTERDAIAASIHEWNALNSQSEKKVLLPVMWESHSAPSMADRPQGIINDQVVKTCDMLIGAFWARLGTPTGLEDSGTVEEIKWFLKNEKPVMLYYSDAPIPRKNLDTKQLDKLEEFKSSIRNKGIQEQYGSVDELKSKLSRQLTIVMRGMSVGTAVNAAVVREAKESTKLSSATPAKSSPQKSDKIVLEGYTDKSFIVRGNTKQYKEELKGLGGKWIKCRDETNCWNFSKRRLTQVAELLGVPAKLND
ncbi:MAG: hypothetical protein Q7T70_04355 [Polaromonas sp.]|nr:hypothetical protein [Polaromonas sp.]